MGTVSGRSGAAAEELASELLALKKASGLSFAQLSQKTHYAKSSWERWVNGKQFPPRDAVESLARLCETPPARLLDIWDRADEEREVAAGGRESAPPESDPGAGTSEAGAAATAVPRTAVAGADAAPADGAGSEAAPARRGRRGLWISAVVALVLVAGAAAAYAGVGTGGEEPAPRPSVRIAGPATGCEGTGCEGKDPKKMNCGADAVTVRTGSIPKDLVMELRYSRACQAAWGRITFAEVGATVVVNNSDGAAAADVVHYDRDVYTPLIAAPESGSTWVCASLPKGKQSCTGYFVPSQER
ncbi:DUF2690 domain-containing protein [Streptomyces sp. MS191]|uniref:DUF2690 domain-containing protein n=1 Tax=Streptomyces sp. ms191 TaxID=1827978 RepID=UPI00164F2048|nr:DUF2690 domain-containing protein [Streptomyces sp. ms191]